MARGWWALSTDGVEELFETDLEHIAEMIKQGFTSGDLVQDDEETDTVLATEEGNIIMVSRHVELDGEAITETPDNPEEFLCGLCGASHYGYCEAEMAEEEAVDCKARQNKVGDK